MSEQILVTTQPAATAEPIIEQVAETTVQDSVTSVTTKEQSASVAEALPLVTLGVQQNAAPQQRQRKPSSFRYGFFRFLRIVNKIFSGLLRVFLIVLAGIGVVILVVFMLGLSFGSVAANGAVIMLIGNGILRAAHLSHYTTNRVAAIIGAVGSLVAGAVLSIPINCVTVNQQDENGRPRSSWTTYFTTVLVGTLTGTFGAAILKHYHFDLEGTDVLHATRAGALGGAILGSGVLFLIPLVVLAIFIILSPIWIAMRFGVEWIYAKSSESWIRNNRGYRQLQGDV